MANQLTKIPKFRRCVLQNFPFIEQDFDALTDYQLLCKVVEYLNKVITSQNEVIEITDSLTSAFNELQSFVEDYFDNLDVQDEINNKLDEMAEAGTLQEIIASYIQANTAWCFDTIADMKTAENLIDGSFAQTLGYHSLNDGGKAIYKIREVINTDVVDESFIIALADNNLVAVLVSSTVLTPETLGAYGDGTHDDTAIIQKACTYLNSIGGGELLLRNQYRIDSEIDISSFSNITFNGDGKGKLIKPLNNNTNIFFGDYAKTIKFYNLNFEGNRPETLSFVWPHTMNAATICRYGEDITLENCSFKDFWYGVCTATSENSHNARIDKCNFKNCNSDIDLYGKPVVSITNVSSDGCTGNSIQIEPSSATIHETTFNYLQETDIDKISVNNIIDGCSIINCAGIAINIHSGNINTIITNNTIANCGRGINCYHIDMKNLIIANNTILNMTEERTSDNARSIYPEGSGISITRNTYGAIITGNIINHARCGIFAYGSSNDKLTGIVIKGNSVQYCKASGIALINAENCQVSDNYMYNNAIGLDGGTTYYKNSGIYLESSTKINCDSNYCNDTSDLTTRQRACVYIDSSSCTDITVCNCTGINMVENPVNNDAATHGCYADGTKVYTSPFTAITNTN